MIPTSYSLMQNGPLARMPAAVPSCGLAARKRPSNPVTALLCPSMVLLWRRANVIESCLPLHPDALARLCLVLRHCICRYPYPWQVAKVEYFEVIRGADGRAHRHRWSVHRSSSGSQRSASGVTRRAVLRFHGRGCLITRATNTPCRPPSNVAGRRSLSLEPVKRWHRTSRRLDQKIDNAARCGVMTATIRGAASRSASAFATCSGSIRPRQLFSFERHTAIMIARRERAPAPAR